MNNPMLQLLVLAGIAVFLVLRLRNVLGTREGFEQPPAREMPQSPGHRKPELEVIEGGPDRDVIDHVAEGSPQADALLSMKSIDHSFMLGDFLAGARGAYEMIVMGFEKGELEEIKPFLAPDIYDTFAEVVAARKEQGLTIEAEFIGVREMKVIDATLDEDTHEAEIIVRFTAELTSAVKNAAGEVIEGSASEVKRQKDTWAFAHDMGSENPNWMLVSTDA
jgi:predicted lipid-binding transport protein (Tim44 family)